MVHNKGKRIASSIKIYVLLLVGSAIVPTGFFVFIGFAIWAIRRKITLLVFGEDKFYAGCSFLAFIHNWFTILLTNQTNRDIIITRYMR